MKTVKRKGPKVYKVSRSAAPRCPACQKKLATITDDGYCSELCRKFASERVSRAADWSKVRRIDPPRTRASFYEAIEALDQ